MNPPLTLPQKLVLPSMSDLIVVMVFTVMILLDPMIKSYDLFWHLRTGELMLNGIYPQTDLFSYTAFGKPWILHEWGSQVIFAWIYQKTGFAGLIVLKSLVYALMYGLAFKLLLKKNIHIFLSFGLIFLLIYGTIKGWTVRPHMFTNLFLVILFWIYVCFKENGNQKILWVLPVLFCLWINLHGGFVIGFVFLGACLGAELVDAAFHRSKYPAGFRPWFQPLLTWSALSMAACFINPNTAKGVFYPLMYLGDQMDIKMIREWAAPSMHTEMDFFVLMLFILGGLVFQKKNLETYEMFLVLIFSIFAFSALRHIPVFAFVTIPIMAGLWQANMAGLFRAIQAKAGGATKKYLGRVSQFVNSRAEEFFLMEKQLCFHLIPVCVILMLTGISLAVPDKIGIGLNKDRLPIDMVDHIKSSETRGNLFNQYGWGGFLLWAIPDQKVFIDGRMDVYQRKISDPYNKILNLEPGWESLIQKYDIRRILVKKETPIALFLSHVSDDWILEKETGNACFFSRQEFFPL